MIGWAPWALSGVLGLAPAAAQTVASDLELGPLRLEMGVLGELAEPLALPALLPLSPMLAVSSGTPRRDELDCFDEIILRNTTQPAEDVYLCRTDHADVHRDINGAADI